MSVPRSIGWAVFLKGSPEPYSQHLYHTRSQAMAAHYRDGAWEYKNQHPDDIRAQRQTKVLTRYDIKEVFVND